MAMENVLDQVLEGKWDREAFAKEFDDPQSLRGVGYTVSGMQLDKKLDAPELCKNFAVKLEATIEKADARMKSALQYVTGRLYIVAGDKEKGMQLIDAAKVGAPEDLVKEIDSFLESTK